MEKFELQKRFELESELRQIEIQAVMDDMTIKEENKRLLKEQYDLQTEALEQMHQDNITRIDEEAAARRLEIVKAENDARINAYQSMASASLRVIGAFGKQSFQSQKNFAIAESIVSIAGGVAKALNNPYPANLAFAAQVAAQGAALISTIRSTKPSATSTSLSVGGGSSTSSYSSVGGQSVSNIPQVQQQKLTLEFIGSDSEVFTLQSIKEAAAKSDEFATIVVTSIDDAKRRGAIDA